MSTLVSPFPVFRAMDSTGKPLAGGKLYTYVAGTSTAQATYTDASGGQANTNPVVLDAAGQANVWLLRSAYKFVLKDANDVTQWTVDNINVTPSKVVDVEDYGAVGDGSTDDSAAFQSAANAAGAWGTIIVKRPATSYKLDTNILGSYFWQLMGSAITSGVGTLSGLVFQQQSGGGLSVGGTTLCINSTGKIGVGTNAPAELIDVAGNLNFPYVSGVPSGKIMWNSAGSGTGYGGSIEYGIDDYESMTFKNNNNSITFGYSKLILGAAVDNRYVNLEFGGCNTELTRNHLILDPAVAYSTFIRLNTAVGTRNWEMHATAASDTGDALRFSYTGTSGYSCDQFVLYTNGGSYGSSTFNGRDYANTRFSGNGTAFGATVLNLMDFSGPANTTTMRPSLLINGNSNTGTGYAVGFLAVAANLQPISCGTISCNYGAYTTSYNTSSDYRLKENLRPVYDALEILNAVPMYKGNFKTAPDEPMEFALAHEVQAQLPYAVMGAKDAVDESGNPEYQQLDYSKLVPVLWAAVQQLSKEVDNLKKELGK